MTMRIIMWTLKLLDTATVLQPKLRSRLLPQFKLELAEILSVVLE